MIPIGIESEEGAEGAVERFDSQAETANPDRWVRIVGSVPSLMVRLGAWNTFLVAVARD